MKATQYVRVGDEITIQCMAKGRPVPDITWRQTANLDVPDLIITNDTRRRVMINEARTAPSVRVGTIHVSMFG